MSLRPVSAQPRQAGDIEPVRPELGGIGRVWLIIALAILAARALSITTVYDYTALGLDIQSGLVVALGILPALFVTLLAFTLAARALDRPSSPQDYWYALVTRVLVPYIVWSFLYLWFTGPTPHRPFARWLRTAAARTIEGNASYQLFYVLLAIQLLLLMPAILRLLTRLEHHPGSLLAGSFVLQLALITLDYRYIQTGAVSSRWAVLLNDADDRLFLFYPFFIVLGVLAARHRESARRLVHRWRWWLVAALGVSLVAVWLRYVYGLVIEYESLRYATAPLQPTLVILGALAAVACVGIICRRPEPRRAIRPRDRLGRLLTRAGFGIVLVQGFTLNWTVDQVGTRLPLNWPAAPQVIIIWTLAALGAAGLSLLLLFIPGFSRLIGQPCAAPRLVAPFRRIAARTGILTPQRRRSPRARGRWQRAVIGAALVAVLALIGESGPVVTSAVAPPAARPVVPGKENRVRISPIAKTSASGASAATNPSTSTSEGTITCKAPPPHDFATCLFTERSGKTMTFYLFTPAGYNPSHKYPLVLLLHGGGQSANAKKSAAANRRNILSDPYVAVWGPGYAEPDSPDVQQHWPSFIVVPQIVAPNRWVDVPAKVGSYTMTPQPNDSLRMAKEIVDTLQQRYAGIDPNRLYVTGLSMGGYGTWEMIERWPDEFAAAGPLCGAGDPSKAAVLKNVPIWAFHSVDDPVVPVSGSRNMIAAIRAAGGRPRYTEMTNVGHNVWLDAYQLLGKPTPTPGFYQWLFSQHKSVGATP